MLTVCYTRAAEGEYVWYGDTRARRSRRWLRTQSDLRRRQRQHDHRTYVRDIIRI